MSDPTREALMTAGQQLIELLRADLDVTSHTLVAARDFVDAALSTTPAPDELWNRIAAIPFSEDGTLPDHAGPMLAPTLRDYRRRILETIRSTQ